MDTKRKRIQYLIILVGLLSVALSRRIPSAEKYLVTVGLAIVSGGCIWMGIDFFKIEKRVVGCMLILSAAMVLYLAVKLYIVI